MNTLHHSLAFAGRLDLPRGSIYEPAIVTHILYGCSLGPGSVCGSRLRETHLVIS